MQSKSRRKSPWANDCYGVGQHSIVLECCRQVDPKEATSQILLVGDTITEVHAGDKPALLIDIYSSQDLLSFFEEFERVQNRLQRDELTLQSEEGQKLNNAPEEKFGIEMFPEQFPPIIEEYGLTL